MTAVSEVIIWVSPMIGALAVWLLHQAYESIKDDIKDLKDRQIKTRDDLSELKSDVRMTSNKVADVDKSVDIVTNSIKHLDQRTGDTKELSLYFKTMENKISEYNSNYGKVILILQKIVAKSQSSRDP